MPANTMPIYTKTARLDMVGSVVGTTANTATDGTGAAAYRVFTAGPDQSFVESITFKPISTIAATVARIFYCSDTGAFVAGVTNTALNSTLIAELSIAAFTASNTIASPGYEVSINRRLPANTKLFITFGTSTGAATTGFNPSAPGGDY